MNRDVDLQIRSDLARALSGVLGVEAARVVSPVHVLAHFLDSASHGYGLTEHPDIDPADAEVPEPPAPAFALLGPVLGIEDAKFDADLLRKPLYDALLRVASDARSRHLINLRGVTREDVLRLGQVYWNLERSDVRRELPLGEGRITTTGGRTKTAAMKHPRENRDLGLLRRTDRTNARGVHPSSAANARRQGAVLAVCVARDILSRYDGPPVDLGAARIELDGAGRVSRLVWTDVSVAATGPDDPTGSQALTFRESFGAGARLVVGRPADVGASYQRRGFDDELDNLWAQESDRRVWLVGATGRGKSYAARRAWVTALAGVDEHRPDVMIWVDAASHDTVVAELARASDAWGLPGVRSVAFARATDAAATAADAETWSKAEALLERLDSTEKRWLVVYDNADVTQLVDGSLLPSIRNPNGRTILTTYSHVTAQDANARVLEVDLFSHDESVSYLTGHLGEESGAQDVDELARLLGGLPLALSTAVATIGANRMRVDEWVREFRAAPRMDEVADERDGGGYPHQVGAAIRVAFDRAAARGGEAVRRAALVAALQDPDGHPTWLWGREGIDAWVTGGDGGPRRPGRMPSVVRALIDTGLVTLRGSWSDGALAMHQLTARAVREMFTASEIAPLAEVLAQEWLLSYTDQPAASWSVVARNLAPMFSLEGVSRFTRCTIAAFADLGDGGDLEELIDRLDRVRPDLECGGASGAFVVARELEGLARRAESLGRPEDGHRWRDEALGILVEMLREESVEGRLRVEGHILAAEIASDRGLSSAAEHRSAAAMTLEQLPDDDSLVGVLQVCLDQGGLVAYHRGQGDEIREGLALAVLDERLARAIHCVQETSPEDGPQIAIWGRSPVEMVATLAGALQDLELDDRSSELLSALEVVAAPISAYEIRSARVVGALARGEWAFAEDLLLESEHIPGPRSDARQLASVQLHLGKVDKSAETLADSFLSARTRRGYGTTSRADWERLPDQRREKCSILCQAIDVAGRAGRWNEALDLCQEAMEELKRLVGGAEWLDAVADVGMLFDESSLDTAMEVIDRTRLVHLERGNLEEVRRFSSLWLELARCCKAKCEEWLALLRSGGDATGVQSVLDDFGLKSVCRSAQRRKHEAWLDGHDAECLEVFERGVTSLAKGLYLSRVSGPGGAIDDLVRGAGEIEAALAADRELPGRFLAVPLRVLADCLEAVGRVSEAVAYRERADELEVLFPEDLE